MYLLVFLRLVLDFIWLVGKLNFGLKWFVCWGSFIFRTDHVGRRGVILEVQTPFSVESKCRFLWGLDKFMVGFVKLLFQCL